MMMLTRKSKEALCFFISPFQMYAVSLMHKVALPFIGFKGSGVLIGAKGLSLHLS